MILPNLWSFQNSKQKALNDVCAAEPRLGPHLLSSGSRRKGQPLFPFGDSQVFLPSPATVWYTQNVPFQRHRDEHLLQAQIFSFPVPSHSSEWIGMEHQFLPCPGASALRSRVSRHGWIRGSTPESDTATADSSKPSPAHHLSGDRIWRMMIPLRANNDRLDLQFLASLLSGSNDPNHDLEMGWNFDNWTRSAFRSFRATECQKIL